jgi:NAD(P)-dependent dehydrogenase (short-subunit alcohol dehydrogenase family)
MDVSPLDGAERAVRLAAEAAGRSPSKEETFVGVRADVTDVGGLRAAVRGVVERLGRLDVAVANAGVFPVRPFEETTPEQWRGVMAVNLDGVANTAWAVLPTMREAGYGRIVVISSGTVWFGVPGLVPYVTSKAGLIGFVRSLAVEVAHDGITVNAITPVLVATEGVKAGPIADMVQEIVAGQLVKRPQRSEDLASTLLWLASPNSGLSTARRSTSTVASPNTNAGQRNGTPPHVGPCRHPAPAPYTHRAFSSDG